MDEHYWQQIQGIFEHLTDKSPGHRSDYLDMVCENNPELRREVESLLESSDQLTQGEQDLMAPLLAVTEELQQPKTVGNYRIVEELGRGGMGVVYLAEHPRYGKVALKLLPRFTVAAGDAHRRFDLEARVLSSLKHIALCRHFESFTTVEYAAIAMEFIKGKGLNELIENGPLPFSRAVNIIIDLSNVLALAHARGLAHRDIKSSNVLLNDQGDIRLIDFGIAKFADTRLTATGQVLGTPAYMSPEQWHGQGIDHRTDLWSLGILLFEMLTGDTPFIADNRLQVASKILKESAPVLPATSCDGFELAAVQALMDRLLRKEPQLRLQSCEDLGASLQALIRDSRENQAQVGLK